VSDRGREIDPGFERGGWARPLVALDEQDRGAWDAALVAEGHRLVRERLAASADGVAPGPLRPVRPPRPSPIVALNRAIAYDKAVELAGNTAETAALTRRRDQLR
jgi:predicted RNA polymerase sigma factor